MYKFVRRHLKCHQTRGCVSLRKNSLEPAGEEHYNLSTWKLFFIGTVRLRASFFSKEMVSTLVMRFLSYLTVLQIILTQVSRL